MAGTDGSRVCVRGHWERKREKENAMSWWVTRAGWSGGVRGVPEWKEEGAQYSEKRAQARLYFLSAPTLLCSDYNIIIILIYFY